MKDRDRCLESDEETPQLSNIRCGTKNRGKQAKSKSLPTPH